MTSYTAVPVGALANVQGFSRVNGSQRGVGHIAATAGEILRLVAAHHPDDSIRVHLPEHEHNRIANDYELELWDTKPDRQLAYYRFPAHEEQRRVYQDRFCPALVGAIVTTWCGSTLGTIIKASVWRHNFGGRQVSLTVVGTNGARYTARASWDHGTCCNLRRVK